MATESPTLKDTLVYLKKKLERTTDDEAVLRIIHKMSKIPITIDLLQGTGAGKIMRVLAKKPGTIGTKASSVLNKWRDVVASTQKTSEASSLKENDHPKEISHHTGSKSHHKSEKETTKYEKHYEEKHIKKEKHNKEKHYENKHINSEHSKEKFKVLIKDEKHYKEKHSMKRSLNEESEHELKKKHFKEKDHKKDHNLEHSKHSNRHSKENHSRKKSIDKTKMSSSKVEKTSSKHSSSFLQKNLSDEDNFSEYPISPFNNEQEFMGSNDSGSAHNSDSSASLEPSPKKARTSETVFDKSSNESRTHSSSYNLNNDRKSSSEFEKSPKKKLKRDDESKTKNSSNEKVKEEKINKKSKAKKLVRKDLKMLSTEEFTSSEATFEDCLSFNDIVPLKKKKSSKSVPNSLSKKVKESFKSSEYSSKSKSSELSSKSKSSELSGKSKSSELSSKSKSSEQSSKSKSSKDTNSSPVSREKEKNDWKIPEETARKSVVPEKSVDIASTLPQTQPNYRPLPQRNYDYSPIKKKENMTNEDAIKFTSSRKEKTAVYSGRKNKGNYLTSVPTLFECCTRVLIENIDGIEYMGEIPYFLLESMLQRCTPAQLYRIEDFNPYLLEDTNELWETHCKRDYRTAKPQENETWRELYWRSHDEREQRLRSVTANISALIANSNPTRKAKLAYVDSVVKPPRDVARRQAKNGTGLPTNHTVKAGPPSKASPRPTAPSINSAASTSRPRVEAKPMKPKIAPLMAKTLKSMKKCFRR